MPPGNQNSDAVEAIQVAGILDDAVKSRRLTANPSRGAENLPHKTGERRVYLTVEDVARLAGESGQHRALVLTLAYACIRWREAVALRVRDVQFLRRRLSVADNAVQLGVNHAVGQTKSRTERSVPMPQFVLDELAVQCDGRGLDDLVFGDGAYLPRPKSDVGYAEIQQATQELAGAVENRRAYPRKLKAEMPEEKNESDLSGLVNEVRAFGWLRQLANRLI